MPLEVLPATPADVPAIVDVYFRAFQTGFAHTLLQDTPAVREWWGDGMAHAMTHDADAYFLKAVDTDGGQLVAFARWVRPRAQPQTEASLPPTFPEGANERLFRDFIGELFVRRMQLMGATPHWYLELLATHPAHQRRGAASLLIAAVLDDPANAETAAYVESSPQGVRLYPRHGFEPQGSLVLQIEGHGPYETLLMPRYVKVKGG
ncbi:uncharacterized protein K452DRAFT_230703 [Aplosporella prunicola CBS 121167]|uniref:N-acetyltransferase domain-containing protein n=1 Tax=Aplosporella prunicola CBS 121167 TaxID=1176127 RepID=A0A6A6BBS5_9PEZI|nr:uncharacterized protein K452DRAFT_230703 [Aplosporella prunicola CBS 121167]KAF2140367.1 hypothetical protein K452DRAFT_230703 [Aplosporella prunicola CBS 121167]